VPPERAHVAIECDVAENAAEGRNGMVAERSRVHPCRRESGNVFAVNLTSVAIILISRTHRVGLRSYTVDSGAAAGKHRRPAIDKVIWKIQGWFREYV
jgi:hypothetical protein